MKVVYFQDPKGNFGDELNPWLWPRLFDGAITGFGHHGIETREEYAAEPLLFYGIGTILDSRIPVEPRKIVFGSGYGYGKPLVDLSNCEILFVRGKRTAKAIGISSDKALTDPAILLRDFFPIIPMQDRIHDVSFMPHHSTVAGDFWQSTCEELGINYICPTGFDIEAVVKQLSSSRLVIAEAMHAAIVADAFRVPWIPVTSVPETNPFKWHDWCESLELEYRPRQLMPIFKNSTSNLAKDIFNRGKLLVRRHELKALIGDSNSALLSSSDILDARRLKMDQHVQDLRNRLLGDVSRKPC